MKILIFVTCLTAIVAHESNYEDDEVVVVEDVVEDERPRHRFTEDSAGRNTDSSNTKKRTKPKSLDEVLASCSKHMTKMAIKHKKWDVYEDGAVIASFSALLESEMSAFPYHYATLKAKNALDAEKNADKFEQAVEIQTSYEGFKSAIQEQVEKHQTLMRSTEELVGTRSKNLAKYIAGRLKAVGKTKKLDRMLSSKENIKEMLKLQTQIRGTRMHGLSENELLRVLAACVLPSLFLFSLRASLIHWRIFDTSLSTSTTLDVLSSTLFSYSMGFLVAYKAGFTLLTTTQLCVLALIVSFLSLIMMCLTTIGLKVVRINMRRSAGKNKGKKIQSMLKKGEKEN